MRIPTEITAQILSDGRLRFVLKDEIFGGMLNIYSVIIGQAKLRPEIGLVFEPEATSIGRLPGFITDWGPLRTMVKDRYRDSVVGMVDRDTTRLIVKFQIDPKKKTVYAVKSNKKRHDEINNMSKEELEEQRRKRNK